MVSEVVAIWNDIPWREGGPTMVWELTWVIGYRDFTLASLACLYHLLISSAASEKGDTFDGPRISHRILWGAKLI